MIMVQVPEPAHVHVMGVGWATSSAVPGPDALCYFPFSIRLARSLGAVILVDCSAVRIGAVIACLGRGHREPTQVGSYPTASPLSPMQALLPLMYTSYSGSLTVPHDLRRQ